VSSKNPTAGELGSGDVPAAGVILTETADNNAAKTGGCC